MVDGGHEVVRDAAQGPSLYHHEAAGAVLVVGQHEDDEVGG